MTEPLLHIVIPYITLTSMGVKPKKAFIASLTAIIPDLDALFHVHRSQTHSIPLILATTIPLITLTWKTKLKEYTIPATIALITHPLLDLFTGPTPVLWPLLQQSIWITTQINITITQNTTIKITPTIEIQTTSTTFQQTLNLDAPIITSQGLITTIILLTPTIIQIVQNYMVN